MSETYSRTASMSLKKEVTANTTVIPDTFFHLNDEDIAEQYDYSPSTPISGNRAVNQRAIKNTIKAPAGSINLNIEPKTFGHFLEGLVDLTSGNYVKMSTIVGTFDTTNIVTFAPSSATATPVFVGDDYLIFGTITGTPTTADGMTQATSGATADVDEFDATVFGHAGRIPAEITNTYSVQKNLSDRAYRYMGVRFHGIDSFAQAENIMTAAIQMMAQTSFLGTKVTAIVSSGAGSASIPVDQVQGVVATDTIKVWRDGTGFLDFSAASVKTHTVDAVDVANLELDVTNLEVALAVGDIILLAPQTPSYTIADEFAWIGCAQMSIGADKDNFATEDVQDFTMIITYELEERHSAQGVSFATRFPSDILHKGLEGSGTFSQHNEDESFRKSWRLNTDQAIKLLTEGSQIASTGVNYKLQVIYSKTQFDNYDLSLSADDMVEEEVPFTGFYNDNDGYFAELLLVNDITSY